jgi:hypothetical protein
MNVGYARPGSVDVAAAMRLGLRARVRAVLEARMVSARSRRRLAEALEHAIVRAERPQRAFTAAVPISPEAVRDAQGALLDLAERLRAPRPVDADGIRLARALLIDGAGPLYVTTRPGELRQAALRALGALDGVRR